MSVQNQKKRRRKSLKLIKVTFSASGLPGTSGIGTVHCDSSFPLRELAAVILVPVGSQDSVDFAAGHAAGQD